MKKERVKGAIKDVIRKAKMVRADNRASNRVSDRPGLSKLP